MHPSNKLDIAGKWFATKEQYSKNNLIVNLL